MRIKVKNQQKAARIKAEWVKDLLRRALELEGSPQAEVSILLVDDLAIRALNKKYRGTDKATDVLAFSQREGFYPEINPDLLGDIVISVETALNQSKQFSHPLKKEISLYLIHGLLHLLGYDDVQPSGQARMKKRQEEILRRIER